MAPGRFRVSMRIVQEQFPQIGRPFAVCIGKFESLHIGHRQILDTLIEEARGHGALAVAYSFEPRNGGALTTPREKERLLEALGVDLLVVARLTEDFMALEPEQFLARLAACGSLRAVAVGANFRFGRGASGDAALIAAHGRAHGFDTHIIPQVEADGQPVSSTLIRACVASGDVARAARLLGRAYSLTGEVVAGRRIGRTLGFPTANLLPPEGKLIPAGGIYATWAEMEGVTYPAMTNIGTNPTVHGGRLVIESHLIGFDGDLYGRELTLRFVRKTRDEVKFAGVEQLTAQLRRDREEVLKILG